MKLMLAQNTAQQRAAARTEQQAQGSRLRRFPCGPPLGGLSGPADGMAGGPTPALTAKGQGRAPRRCVR